MKKNSVKIKMALCLVGFLLLAGCGLKANPVPPMSDVANHKKSEPNITAAIEGKAVVLAWQMQNPAEKISYISVWKSQRSGAGEVCRDCPRTFEQIGQLPANDPGNKKGTYNFTDRAVETGIRYSYRLKICDVAGACRESQAVEIDFK
ncbi:MAG: hypothetical protein K4571_06685 [Deltaproteobacteria bacterium]